MRAKPWETLWATESIRELWSRPEEGVQHLVPRMKAEGVRRVLDLGCGIGRHVILLAKSGLETCGFDSSAQAVASCQEWLLSERCEAKLHQGDMHCLPYEDDFFGFVLSWNVIYHTTREGMSVILAETERVLRHDGLLYLTLNSTRNKHCGGGTEVEPNTFDNPEKEDGRHLHHYSDREDAEDLLSRFHIERLEEVEQNSFKGDVFPGSWHWTILARKVTQ